MQHRKKNIALEAILQYPAGPRPKRDGAVAVGTPLVHVNMAPGGRGIAQRNLQPLAKGHKGRDIVDGQMPKIAGVADTRGNLKKHKRGKGTIGKFQAEKKNIWAVCVTY